MQLTAIPDPLPVPRGSAAAAAPVTAVTPTAALPVEAPTVLPDFGSSNNADTASQTAARDRRASGGTPVDAPATIIDFSTTAAEGVEPEADPVAELLTRIAERLGGQPTLAAVLVLCTGIFGAMVVTPFLNLIEMIVARCDAEGVPVSFCGEDAGRPIEADPSGDNVTIEFNLDGLTAKVESPKSAHETVLNAALRVRSDVPFACAGGVCGTCRAKVVDGAYEMDENYALEKDEVEKGYVLTCQTRPTSDSITLDFDA